MTILTTYPELRLGNAFVADLIAAVEIEDVDAGYDHFGRRETEFGRTLSVELTNVTEHETVAVLPDCPARERIARAAIAGSTCVVTVSEIAAAVASEMEAA